MRAFQIFSAMTPERTAEVLETISKESPSTLFQVLQLAAATMNARPNYLQRQPFAKRAAAVRRGLARVAANDAAEEVLAVYFLQCRQAILTEWLDLVGLEHEEGILKAERPAEPPADDLKTATEKFLSGEERDDRELLLQAFLAQSSIEWPSLEALVTERASS